MSKNKYELVSRGTVKIGSDKNSVANKLSELLGGDADTIREKLIVGEFVRIKSDDSRALLKGLEKKVAATGLDVFVRLVEKPMGSVEDENSVVDGNARNKPSSGSRWLLPGVVLLLVIVGVFFVFL
ncbi:MAG: hypothetical protein ACRBHB_04715 [Arenicella sp.]